MPQPTPVAHQDGGRSGPRVAIVAGMAGGAALIAVIAGGFWLLAGGTTPDDDAAAQAAPLDQQQDNGDNAVIVEEEPSSAAENRDDVSDSGRPNNDDVQQGTDPNGPVPGATACAVGDIDGDLSFYNWSFYMDPALIEAFEAEYGVTVTEDFYPSNQELFARVESGGAQYDVIVPSDYMVDIMIQEELLLELNFDAIPNVDNVSEEFTSPPYDPDLAFSVPYLWGTTGLGVDLSVTGEVNASWALVFDELTAANLGGRISLLDDPRETMAAALYYLGLDPNTTDEDELQQAADLISEARAWTAAFTSDQYSDLLLGGETVVAHGYSGNFLDNFGDDESYTYLIPREGATIWTDNLAILADASAPCTAHTFVNFILDAENGAQLTNWTFYASPNEAAKAFIDEELLSNPAVFPPPEVMDSLHFLEDLGVDEVLFTDLFMRARS